MKLAIIILHYQNIQNTLDCLRSLTKQLSKNDFILIIDNSQDQKLKKIVSQKYHQIDYLKNPRNLGFAAGNNRGLKLALKQKPDYFLLLNNDTIVSKDFLKNLRAGIQKTNLDIAGCKILEARSKKTWFLGGGYNWLLARPYHFVRKIKHSQIDFITGCCMLIKMAVIKKIGYLDPKFFLYFEDVDFCLRAIKAGFKLGVIPKAILYHQISAATGGTAKPMATYYEIRNNLLLIKKHYSNFAKIFIYPLFFLRSLKRILNLYLHHIDNKKLIIQAFFKAYFDFFQNKFGRGFDENRY